MGSNLYNLRPQKQNDYTKENIDRSMSFTQFGNDIDKDALLFLQHNVNGTFWRENLLRNSDCISIHTILPEVWAEGT